MMGLEIRMRMRMKAELGLGLGIGEWGMEIILGHARVGN